MHSRVNFGSYWEAITIPFVVMIIWGIVVFIVGVLGSVPDLNLEAAGSGIVGFGMGLIGSLLGVIMALVVGFSAVRSRIIGIRHYIVCGALFGLLTSLFAGALDFVLALIGWLSGQPATSGLQGISLKVILSLIGINVDPLWNFGLVIGNTVFLIIISIFSGAILATISGYISEKFFR